MKTILLMLMLSQTSLAGRFEGGDGPGRPGEGGPHRSCDTAAVNSCQDAARNAERLCREQAAIYQSQEKILSADIASRRKNLEVLVVSENNSANFQRVARAELQFLDDLEENAPKSAQFFDGAPSLENIFSVDKLGTDWQLRSPEKYRRKLTDQESELAISRQSFSLRRSEIENEINPMLPALSFLNGEINRWMNDVNIHAARWQRTCKEQICPGIF